MIELDARRPAKSGGGIPARRAAPGVQFLQYRRVLEHCRFCSLFADSRDLGAIGPGRPLALIEGMDDAEFDRLIARAANPNLIPGIYNYCDRRCDRCRFAERCLSHLEAREHPSPPSEHPGTAIGAVVGGSIGRALEMVRIIAERQGLDFRVTPEDRARQERECEAQERRTLTDPLVALSRQYALTTWPITRALWPIVMERGDEGIVEALETIERLCTSVSSKVYRAVRGTTEPDFDATDLQSDPNGSAKIARLIIDESCRAWRVLMEIGRATADGVPARLVRMLDDLDVGVAARFPRAMEFIRPGFDTEPPGEATEGDLDPALAVLPQGHA